MSDLTDKELSVLLNCDDADYDVLLDYAIRLGQEVYRRRKVVAGELDRLHKNAEIANVLTVQSADSTKLHQAVQAAAFDVLCSGLPSTRPLVSDLVGRIADEAVKRVTVGGPFSLRSGIEAILADDDLTSGEVRRRLRALVGEP